jgi:SulP family sulfate permease
VLHSVFLLLFMFLLAPLMVHIPMAALAAVLFVVAWNMSEAHRFVHLMSAPIGDRAVLIVTFLLTVLVDLTVAIEVGVVLAAIIFMHRTANVVAIQGGADLIDRDVDDFQRPASDRYTLRAEAPEGVEVFQIRGPVFFGMANRLAVALDRSGAWPKAIVLRMHQVPFMDATGAVTLSAFVKRCQLHRTFVVITGVSQQVRKDLLRFGITRPRCGVAVFNDFGKALALARQKAQSGARPALAATGRPSHYEPARPS